MRKVLKIIIGVASVAAAVVVPIFVKNPNSKKKAEEIETGVITVLDAVERSSKPAQ
jgi:hypothetical protein